MSDGLVTRLRARLRAGPEGTALREVERELNARVEERGGHLAAGLFCEEEGLVPLAFREFQLAMRDDPADEAAAFHLARLHRERGQAARAATLLEGLLARSPARREWLEAYLEVARDEGALPRAREALARAESAGLPPAVAASLAGRFLAPAEGEPAEADDEIDLAAGDADLVRFHSLFAGREDVHARQWAKPSGESGYSPTREPVTPAVVRQHLLGAYTVGVYPVRLDGTCLFFALDLDIDRAALERAAGDPAEARRLRRAARDEGLRLLGVFRSLGWEPLFEDSGYKGRHLWVFLDEPEGAEAVHQLGRWLLAWQSPKLPPGLHLEFFPRQGKVEGKGLGNLIKLPLGVHRRTGRRAALLDDGGKPLARPLEALRRVRRLARPKFFEALEQVKALAQAEPPAKPASADAKASPAAAKAPEWTSADFDADPEMRHVLRGCPVLAELKRQAEEERRLGHEEQLVLIHSLGHLESGPAAVNYLLSRCAGVGPEKMLKGRLRGHPVSCPSVRKKIGAVTRRVRCSCEFPLAADRYPTPTLHLLTLKDRPAAPAAPGPDAAALAARLAALRRKREEVEREHDQMRRALIDALRPTPERSAACPEGRYVLVESEGVEELRWEPTAPAEPTPTES